MSLLESWKYEFNDWIPLFGSTPVELVQSVNLNHAYRMIRAHIFKLESGQFAFVSELGCSCYGPKDADIDILPDKLSARKVFFKWIVDQKDDIEHLDSD